MQDKKVIILIILGAVAIFSLLYGIIASPKSRRGIVSTGKIISLEERARLEETITPVKRRAKRAEYTSWKRSPFIPKGISGTASSRLVLNGIIGSGENIKAMIGYFIVGKGDKVDGNIVIEVRKDRVILNDGTKDFTLKLRE